METGTESYYSSFDTLIRTTLFIDIFARKIFAQKLIRAIQRRENDRKIKNFKIPAHNCCIAPGIKTKNPTTLNLTINEPILESL